MLHIVCAHDILLSWKDIHAGRLEKMHVQALIARVVMVCIAICCDSIGFSALHLHIMPAIDSICWVCLKKIGGCTETEASYII